MPEMPELDVEKCDCCGLCVGVCPCGAIVMTNNAITITDTEECGWCTLCELVCPSEAITCAYVIVFDEEA